MQVTPKTEEQIEKESKFALWPAGKYAFEIARAEDAISGNKNEMITLTLNVFNDNGESIVVKDFLLDAIAYKLRHACEVCGLLSEYENGHLQAFDFENKRGELELKIEKGKYKNDGSGDVHPDKNAVKDYIVDKNATKPVAKTTGKTFTTQEKLDDEIPF